MVLSTSISRGKVPVEWVVILHLIVGISQANSASPIRKLLPHQFNSARPKISVSTTILGRNRSLSKEELDITNIGLFEAILKENNPDVIINSAAYTAVDKAEENQDLAFEINHKAVENIAKISKRNNKKLIHISTDYVFDGEACKPYSENDQPNPINIYGLIMYGNIM